MAKNYGLKKLPRDERDFKVGSLYKLPDLKDLPDKYEVETLGVKDQKESDFCALFSSATVSEVQEGVELCPEWGFAVAKSIDDDPNGFGTDLRTVCKVMTKYGLPKAEDAPYSLKNKSDSFLRSLANWPNELMDKAAYHRKKSYARADEGPYDPFDNLRASLWKFRDEKRLAVIGLIWSWFENDVYLEKINTSQGGHAVAVVGWDIRKDKDYLIIQNSYGSDAGRNGKHYISREIINKYVSEYGAYMFMDLSREEAEDYLKHGRKADELKLNLLQQLLKLAIEALGLLTKKKR